MRGNRSRSMTKTDSSSSVNCHHSPPLYRSESSAALRSMLAVSESSWSFRVRGFVSLVMGLMPRTRGKSRGTHRRGVLLWDTGGFWSCGLVVVIHEVLFLEGRLLLRISCRDALSVGLMSLDR